MYILTITRGPTKVDEVVVQRQSLRIGRTADNDIRLAEPTVSAHHAILHVDNNAASLEDLRSTNGTYINGRRITVQPLADGDVIAIGQHQLSVRCSGNDPRPGPYESTVELDRDELECLLQAGGAAGTRIRWVAQDASGTWWGFESEPSRTEEGWQPAAGRPAIRLKQGSVERRWSDSLRRL